MANENGTRVNSDALQDVSEAKGLITAEYAANLLGVQKPSFFAIAYEHRDELGAFRMGGIILCEKAKVIEFAAKRKAEIKAREEKAKAKDVEASKKAEAKAVMQKLASLSPDQLARLMASLG